MFRRAPDSLGMHRPVQIPMHTAYPTCILYITLIINICKKLNSDYILYNYTYALLVYCCEEDMGSGLELHGHGRAGEGQGQLPRKF